MTNDKPASDGGAETPAQKIAGEILAASGYKPVRMTVEERYNAERGIKKVPPLKRKWWTRYQSSESGRFISAVKAMSDKAKSFGRRVLRKSSP